MRPNRILFLLIFLGMFVLNFSVTAQDNIGTESEPESGMNTDFGLGLLLGVETFDPIEEGGDPETFQTLALKPDLAIGKFGIGLDLVLHYRFVSDGSGFDIREEDWVPAEGWSFANFLELYLPKITYMRWGNKGDTLYAKVGQIDNALIGTGFIVSQYSNTLFQPDEKIVGLNFDLDGQLFNFPYLGIETFAGNLAHFDVFGARLYSRPLLWSGIPIIKELEWGITAASDIDPDYRADFYETAINNGDPATPVLVWGSDLILPILNMDLATLALFGDLAFQGLNKGGMTGFGGRLFNIIPYIFQLRFLGDNFIPAYFDNMYDLYRGVKYDIYNDTYDANDPPYIESSISWLASTGISILDDLLVFTATVDGPFSAPPSGSTEGHNFLEYPHLYAMFAVNDGLIPSFSFSASYDKRFINEPVDLLLAENSMANLAINYNAGAAVITLSYDMIYIEDGNIGVTWDDFDVSSSLSCSINFF